MFSKSKKDGCGETVEKLANRINGPKIVESERA
jgi:hypothetical protein